MNFACKIVKLQPLSSLTNACINRRQIRRLYRDALVSSMRDSFRRLNDHKRKGKGICCVLCQSVQFASFKNHPDFEQLPDGRITEIGFQKCSFSDGVCYYQPRSHVHNSDLQLLDECESRHAPIQSRGCVVVVRGVFGLKFPQVQERPPEISYKKLVQRASRTGKLT
jgi:hypothetical protein